jgi:hypothetical protein
LSSVTALSCFFSFVFCGLFTCVLTRLTAQDQDQEVRCSIPGGDTSRCRLFVFCIRTLRGAALHLRAHAPHCSEPGPGGTRFNPWRVRLSLSSFCLLYFVYVEPLYTCVLTRLTALD